MIDQCEIIQDLLPLYVDSACSASSTAMIEEHLDNCPKCKRLYEILCSDSGEEILKTEMAEVVAKHEQQVKKKRSAYGFHSVYSNSFIFYFFYSGY